MPLSKLNNEQYLAATADFGHNLVIASAGTEKLLLLLQEFLIF